MAKIRNIVRGSPVVEGKMQFAKQLRKEMTVAEKKLWQILRNNQLDGYHFCRQQIIDCYIVDFYCHEVGLVIEVDGGIHETEIDEDNEREQNLKNRGFRVIHFSNEQGENEMDNVLKEIRNNFFFFAPSF